MIKRLEKFIFKISTVTLMVTALALLSMLININILYASSDANLGAESKEYNTVETYYEYYRDCLLDIEKIKVKSHRSTFNSRKCNKLDEISSRLKSERNEDLKLEEEKVSSLYKKVHAVLSENMDVTQKERLKLILAKVLNIKVLLKNEDSDFNELIEVLNGLSDSSDMYIKEESMFLKASLYDRTKNNKAQFYYKLLADKPFYTKYGIASSVLVGDYYFAKSQYLQAYSYYRKAYENIDSLNYNDKNQNQQIGKLKISLV